IDLAKTVDGNHGIALSPLLPRGEAGQPPPQPSYLEITEHTIPPLPDQSDKPRWEQDWITSELKDLLFGQPDPQAPLRTYLIVDATLRTRISGIFDLDLQDVPVRSLVRSQRAEDLREVAPYLVDMTLPEGAWDDRRQVPNFHLDFFARHWQQGTGILVRTTADMDAVWTHCHPFVRVQVEATQEWVFSRFWEGTWVLDFFTAFHPDYQCLFWQNLAAILLPAGNITLVAKPQAALLQQSHGQNRTLSNWQALIAARRTGLSHRAQKIFHQSHQDIETLTDYLFNYGIHNEGLLYQYLQLCIEHDLSPPLPPVTEAILARSGVSPEKMYADVVRSLHTKQTLRRIRLDEDNTV
ncbi:MAG: DUF4123 domain-containing protein, partial [Pseudomonadota bacterium]